LARNGCRVAMLRELNDVDLFTDIAQVAAGCRGLFAAAAESLTAARRR
jgi:hypothetical protein